VGRVNLNTVADEVATALATISGLRSVKAVLEAHAWTSLATLRVTSVEFDVVTIASVDYISALFHLDIAGQGTT
jgi:hypothetical protein